MWTHIPGETQESVMQRLSARKGGAVNIVKLERDPNETAARSNQIFFSYVSRYVKSRDGMFNDAVFLMEGVDNVIFDKYAEPVGDGHNMWDLYAQLGERRGIIDYWAVHTLSGKHVAYTNIPKFCEFIHFSPCGSNLLTMDISGKDKEMNRCKVTASFYTMDFHNHTKCPVTP
mmetsp:Transcript_13654/g.29543  ORF Transcript_13654/g.29543 Transcript_13654/m.29543 type:complete len:173 (-) Transcript_13654:317-835(-)